MGKSVLVRLESRDFVSRWGIPGHDHLVVESLHDEPSGRRHAWMVRDCRFSDGMDRWNRSMVIIRGALDEVRDWVRAGGPALWDPERRKEDKRWQPVPDALILLSPPEGEEEVDGESGEMTHSEVVRVAKFRAGLILESTLAAGWAESIARKYGEADAGRIEKELAKIAERLISQSRRRP